MNNHPLVTIIVVSYKHSEYIRENLDSIRAQTYNNIQLIVADDASPDHSTAVMDAWLEEHQYPAEKNYHTVNTGLATVLNECIALAKGQYIKLIAADDFLHPEAIEKCVQKLEELGEDYGMVFTDYEVVDQDSIIKPNQSQRYTSSQLESTQCLRHAIITANKIAAPTVLMTQKALQSTGPYPTNYIVEDYYRWIKILSQYGAAYLDEKLCFYRWHDNNITRQKKSRILEETIFIKLELVPDPSFSKSINDAMKWHYLHNGSCSKKLRKAYLNYPFRNKKMAFCLRFFIPSKVYNFVYKVLG